MPHSHSLRMAGFTTLLVCLTLFLLRLVVHLPRQSLLLLTGSFFLIAIPFWMARWGRSVGRAQIAQVLLLWSLLTGVFLFGVYRVDRAGWNWFRLTGYDVTLAEHHPRAANLSIEEFIRRHEMFSVAPDGSNRVLLPRGEHEIDATIVVPKGVRLVIEPGAVLRFGAGCSLISYSPISAIGTAQEAIIFTAKRKLLKWGVVGVVQTEKSYFHRVRFEHARSARVNGIIFFAGLSAIETDIEITDSQFIDMFGKDAVNIRYADALVRDNLFENATKDGIDMDGGTGEISRNVFMNCQDEGIDLSENFAIRVFDNKIQDRRGGRIEAENNLSEIRAANSFGYLP